MSEEKKESRAPVEGHDHDRSLHKYPQPNPSDYGIKRPTRRDGRGREILIPYLNKRERFQLLAIEIEKKFGKSIHNIVDVGGGKGLLSFHLNRLGYNVKLIEPYPTENKIKKFKDLKTNKQVIMPDALDVVCVKESFSKAHANGMDLIVSLHGHGCMNLIIEVAKEKQIPFCILPCCVEGESEKPTQPNQSWFDYLYQKAMPDFEVKVIALACKGQNLSIFGTPK